MAAKFVVKKGSTGKFRFNLLSTNGKVIATSEAYETKRAAMNGIESVKKHASDAEIDDQAGGKRATDKMSTSKKTKPQTTEKAKSQKSKSKKASDTKARDKGGSDPAAGVDMEVNLGPCHYGPDDEATIAASHSDGTGWIAVCDDHVDQAKKDGFEPS